MEQPEQTPPSQKQHGHTTTPQSMEHLDLHYCKSMTAALNALNNSATQLVACNPLTLPILAPAGGAHATQVAAAPYTDGLLCCCQAACWS